MIAAQVEELLIVQPTNLGLNREVVRGEHELKEMYNLPQAI